ncbi:glutathione peroxidase [Spiribacter roseus]|uniref:glutathione peroxidase n=1 Tax=Spiribacter roseus TaxID=1855875 RepID=UPI0013307839|nr:glutathione peroxidase [Spiribacter roseus]KAF0282327.1 glutathione peroxidase [Spiribacter roseus]
MRIAPTIAVLLTLLLGGIAMASTATAGTDWLDHDMRRLHSSEVVNVQDLAGDVPAVLLVNTASHCGFTGQFEGLEALHQTYADRGLKVIGFSSDSFNQEADDEAAAAETCFVNFGVSFDMMATVPVRGGDAHPVFAELARQSRAPRWNFNKYLINPAGEVVEVFGAMTRPGSDKVKRAIERLL